MASSSLWQWDASGDTSWQGDASWGKKQKKHRRRGQEERESIRSPLLAKISRLDEQLSNAKQKIRDLCSSLAACFTMLLRNIPAGAGDRARSDEEGHGEGGGALQ